MVGKVRNSFDNSYPYLYRRYKIFAQPKRRASDTLHRKHLHQQDRHKEVDKLPKLKYHYQSVDYEANRYNMLFVAIGLHFDPLPTILIDSFCNFVACLI